VHRNNICLWLRIRDRKYTISPIIVKDNPVPGGPLNFNTQFYDAGGALKIRSTGYVSEAIDELFGCSFVSCLAHVGKFLNGNGEVCDPSATLTLADNFGVGGERTTSNCDDSVLSYHVDQLKTFPKHFGPSTAGSNLNPRAMAISGPATNSTIPSSNSTATNSTISLPITDDD
jgi:hypothetical protein